MSHINVVTTHRHTSFLGSLPKWGVSYLIHISPTYESNPIIWPICADLWALRYQGARLGARIKYWSHAVISSLPVCHRKHGIWCETAFSITIHLRDLSLTQTYASSFSSSILLVVYRIRCGLIKFVYYFTCLRGKREEEEEVSISWLFYPQFPQWPEDRSVTWKQRNQSTFQTWSIETQIFELSFVTPEEQKWLLNSGPLIWDGSIQRSRLHLWSLSRFWTKTNNTIVT